MIAAGAEKAQGTALPVSFRAGDARKLPFPDASFDAVRIGRTLRIPDNSGRIPDEMARVPRPHGRPVAIGPDEETCVCSPGSRDSARTFFRFCADRFPNGSTGRTLCRCFRKRGLADVIVHPEPLDLHGFALVSQIMNMEQFLSAAHEQGVLTRDGVDAWLAGLNDAGAKGPFAFAGMMFAVAGRMV